MTKMKKLFAVLLVASFVIGVVHHAFAEDSQKININTATVSELIKLDRIGLAFAQRIVQYREEGGPFQLPEDIMKVKVSEKRLLKRIKIESL